MSLLEKLSDKREQNKQEEENLKDQLDQEKQKKEARSKLDEQGLINDEINSLKEEKSNLAQKRDELNENISNFEGVYKEAYDANDEFKESSEDLDLIFNEYQDILSDKGIKSKGDLVEDEKLGKEKESLKYKEGSKKRREAVTEISELKKTRPDLNFRGGKIEGEDKSSRDLAFETMNKEVEEVNQAIERIDQKIEALSSKLDDSPEKLLSNLAQEEFEKVFGNIKFDNLNFHIHGKMGVYIGPDLLSLGDEYGDEVIKKMLMEKIAPTYNYNMGLEHDKETLRGNIDFLWLEASINKINNHNYTDKANESLLYYLKKKIALKNILDLIDEENISKISPDIQFTVSKDIYHNLYFWHNSENRKYYDQLKEKRKQYLEEIENKRNEDHHILEKKSIFLSKTKKEKASLRFDFYGELRNSIKDLNFYKNFNDKIVDKARELENTEVITNKEYEEFNEFIDYYKETALEYQKKEKEKNDLNKNFDSLKEYVIEDRSPSEANKVLGEIFSERETLNAQDILSRIKKEFEDIKEHGRSADLLKAEDNLKKMHLDLVRLTDKNRYNIKKDAYDIKGYFDRHFSYDKEISPELYNIN